MKKYLCGLTAWAAFGLLIFSAPAFASAAKFKFDTVHTNVDFQVRHLFSKVNGRFTDFSGSFEFDEKAKKADKVKFEINAKSINTDNKKRDEHLNSPDFFDTAKKPKITFVSTKVENTSGNKFKIYGKLTMREATKDVVLDGEFLGAGPGPGGSYKAGFTITGELNRKDYGIVWNKQLDSGGWVVGDEVKVNISVEADRE